MLLKRDGMGGLLAHLNFLNESQYRDRDALEEYRSEKLKKICIHAYENTAFYKKRFDEAGFNPYTQSDKDAFKRIPLLTKNDIRDHLQEMLARNIDKSALHFSETGGTTGVKMTFYRDNACMPLKDAALYRYDIWAGWQPGERFGVVWPAQQDYLGHWTWKSRLRNSLYKREIVFPAAILTDELISGFLQKILRHPPSIIRAFTSPIMEVADYIFRHDIKIKGIRGIVTTGEPLYAHQRAAIEKAFQCSVFNSYRTREAGPIAQECEMHDGLHINAESLYVETVQDSGPGDNDAGEVVITDLLNYGMPLIRYRMGDIGKISEKTCSCGRGLPLLEGLAGRTGDMLLAPDGRKITSGSMVLYLVDQAPGNVGQVQIIQDAPDHLLIRMTKEPPVTDTIIAYQKQTVVRLFGTMMRADFEFVDHIHREPSGKYMFTKNLINSG